MVLFVLISDIDKSYKSWYEWIPYNSKKKIKTNFVKELEKIGKVFIPKPNFVNFRKFSKYDNNNGYDGDIYFSIDDLRFENYSKWVYNQIDGEDKGNIIVIGFEQGCHHAKFFANKYHKDCMGLFILGNRILSKQNYEKIKNEKYYESLKQYFGKEWEKYTIDNINDTRLKRVLDGVKDNKDYIMFLNGFIKLYTRSQYKKITKSFVSSFIYSYANIISSEKLDLDRKYKKNSSVEVNFYYLDDSADYFIYGDYKDEILERIKCFIKEYYNKEVKKTVKKQVKTGAKRIILLIGIPGSGKTTLGNKIKEKFKNIVIIDSDEVNDSSFLELYENNEEYRKLIESGEGEPWEMKRKLNIKKRDKIIEKNKDKIIIFVGFTIPLDDIVHDGYYLDTKVDTNFKQINLRTLDEICYNIEILKKYIKEDNPKWFGLIVLYKYKIRHQFPIYYLTVKEYYNNEKKEAQDKGYKIMTEEEILNDMNNELEQKGGKNSDYYKKYIKYKNKYNNNKYLLTNS